MRTMNGDSLLERAAARAIALYEHDNAAASAAWRGASRLHRDRVLRDLMDLGDHLPHRGPDGSTSVPHDTGEPRLEDKVITVHRLLTAAAIPYALGDVLALAHYAEPRTTVRIELHGFGKSAEHLGIRLEDVGATVHDDARCGRGRLWIGSTPITVTIWKGELAASMRRSSRLVPFGPVHVPILGPEHLALDRALSGRAQDWLDIEQMLVGAPDADRAEVLGWLEDVVGADDPRTRRFAELLQRLSLAT